MSRLLQLRNGRLEMKSIEAIANKFKSGNSIPCEFARVYLAEWEAIVAEVAKL